MPNSIVDDLRLSHAYLLWVRQAPEERRGTLPDREVEITVPAMPPYPEEVVHLGEELHSFLNPTNPGAGENLVEALSTGGVPVDNLKDLGWHIHPGILNDDQLANWTTSVDLRDASRINRLYEEGRVSRGYVPSKIDSLATNEKRGIPEPDWSVRIRRRLHDKKDGNPLGPAAAWALIDNGVPIKPSPWEGYAHISAEAQLDSQRAALERSKEYGRNIRALYEWEIIPREHVPASGPRGKKWPDWVKETLKRIVNLAQKGGTAAAWEETEIAALHDATGLTLEPTKNGQSFRISAANLKKYPAAAILAALDKLEPELREYGPSGPSQQAAPGAAEPAPQLGASFGQPPASPSFQPSAPPFPQAFPQNPTWAEATRAFAPPVPSGYQNPSSAGQADMPRREAEQQRSPQQGSKQRR
ncbi:hypothetical protein ACQEU8_03875 [Streptomyces sp. CA-250714]|uniref:hypothetical protein n=1 Tax=Streptomyces sp. CA-250714 TaxID=3240060 RepID=UPI003D9163ED